MNDHEGQFIALEFGASKSLRYHAARRSFFDILHKTVMIIAAIGGSTAFLALIEGRTLIAQITAALIAVTAAFDVAIGFSGHARVHDDLYRRWSDLLAEMIRHGPPTEEVLRDWLADRTLIEKEEPTPLSALNVMCHNEEAEVRGYGEDKLHHVRWYQRAFCHLLTLPPNKFPSLAEKKKRSRVIR